MNSVQVADAEETAATSSSLALVEDGAAFDVVGGLVWHWAEGMDYYVVSVDTAKGRDIGLHVPNTTLLSGPPP